MVIDGRSMFFMGVFGRCVGPLLGWIHRVEDCLNLTFPNLIVWMEMANSIMVGHHRYRRRLGPASVCYFRWSKLRHMMEQSASKLIIKTFLFQTDFKDVAMAEHLALS